MTKKYTDLLFTEIAEDENPSLPVGVLDMSPFKEVRVFSPQTDSASLDWLAPYEQKYFAPLGTAVADNFGVSLLTDILYAGGSDAEKKSLLSVIMTRAEAKQIKPGIWGLFPIVVVAAKYLTIMIEAHIDVANNLVVWPKALLWSNITNRYEIVVDPHKGYITDPFILPKHIIPKYISVEKLFE